MRPSFWLGSALHLTALTATKTNRLSIFLELGDQGIAVLDNVRVLLVLVIRSVGLDDSIHTVDRA